MVSFCFAGVRWRVTLAFFAVAAVFLWIDGGGFALAFLGGALLHELGHLLALAFLRCPVRLVELTARGMQIFRAEAAGMSPAEEAIILLAGPGTNLLLALLLPFLGAGGLLFSAANCVLGIYHLLPVGGLDGGTLLELWLVWLLGAHRGMRTAQTVSLCFCMAAVVALSLTVVQTGLSPGLLVLLLLFIFAVMVRPGLG